MAALELPVANWPTHTTRGLTLLALMLVLTCKAEVHMAIGQEKSDSGRKLEALQHLLQGKRCNDLLQVLIPVFAAHLPLPE